MPFLLPCGWASNGKQQRGIKRVGKTYAAPLSPFFLFGMQAKAKATFLNTSSCIPLSLTLIYTEKKSNTLRPEKYINF